MIIRTTPELPREVDVARVLERLECQLRRAADDLAAAVEGMRNPVPELPPATPQRVWGELPARPICGAPMPLVAEPCARRPGHRHAHRSAYALRNEREQRCARRSGAVRRAAA